MEDALTDKPTEFKNENISVKVTKKPGNLIIMNVSVTPIAAQAAYSKAIKMINKEVTLPGFRKGKAPDDFIVRNYSKQIESQFRDVVLQTGIQEALSLNPGFYPYKKDGIRCTEIQEMSREKGAQFTLEFEAAPQVPLIDLNEITLSHVDRRPVTQQDIDRIMQDLSFRVAKWEEVTDHPVDESNFVDLDIDKLDEPQQNICTDARFAVKDMAPWMQRIVVGLNKDESGEGLSEKDKSVLSQQQEEETEFKPTRCRITVKRILNPIVPENPDELAKRFGLKMGAELQEGIVADLNKNADIEVRENLRRQVDMQLLDKYHFELPSTLLESELEQRKQDALGWLEHSGATPDVVDKRKHEIESNLPSQVERSVRLYFIFVSFANTHKIPVTQEEIAQELSQQILRGNIPQQDRNSNEIQNRLSQIILMRKCRDYIIDHVKRA